MSWTEISASGRMPPPRHSHLLAMTNGNLEGGPVQQVSPKTSQSTTLNCDRSYLFGGLDELGAQSTAMYRIALPSGVNYSTLKPEWVEWESELPYNKSRSCTIFNGSLSCYQLRYAAAHPRAWAAGQHMVCLVRFNAGSSAAV
eukprot:359006-Chlamydomonas_euryale.AAC.6